MDDREAIRILESNKTEPGLYEALAIAKKALKKRPSYLRQIERYQERDANQKKQITELQARYEALRTEKSEVMAKLEEMVGEYENDGEYGYFDGIWTGIMEAIKVIENGGKRE